jgi:phosphoesterase RecJ-like protein
VKRSNTADCKSVGIRLRRFESYTLHQNMNDKLKELIEKSQSILITSHVGPDADSLCSSILMGQILKTNFPNKQIVLSMEEEYRTLSFLENYGSIEFKSLPDALNEHKPQLLIILDGNNVPRCTRQPEAARKLIADGSVGLVVIDHHEPIDIEPGALYINQKSPAVTQDVYEILLSDLKLEKPKDYAQTAMIGIYSDTGGFTYDNPRNKDTFKMASELIADGASTELAASQLTQYSHNGLEVLAELIKNIHQTKECTYTYVSDEFYKQWQDNSRPADAIHEGFDIFLHNFLRNIEGRFWGFAVYPDQNAKVKTYSVSFRSLQGRVDVSQYARKLGGGGHRPAAGAKIETDSVENALASVKAAVGLVE